ncbi:hypothetical protein SAMN05421541_106323 [Actinoplanes philippinensis]|uniref:Uncharacterized protein n=1 Tax=Actinoplanes philippinensis TaxID=35752 RepID=A0A1I2G7W7_9ACTN|nr:hypothetical protein [Actinoplanes philippinensis]SFF13824.1 hypothetical protein SAMN05421541_106323 [Actinoplanes philippinensis]
MENGDDSVENGDDTVRSAVRGRVVIDASNVCRMADLPVEGRSGGRPAASRLRRVIAEWRRQHGKAADLVLVADRSLRHRFDDCDASGEWDSLNREFDFIVESYADPWILDLAAAERRFVLSGDLFRGHRRSARWIEDDPQRFLKPRLTGDAMRFVPSGVKPEDDHVKTHSEEADLLRGFGFSSDRHDHRLAWFRFRWQCRNPRCWTARNPDRERQMIPVPGRDGRPACWECGGPLHDGQPRLAWAEIKVTDLSRTVVWHRFLVESGDPVVVGRGLTADGISLDLLADVTADPERLRAVSRQHVLLSLDDSGELTATDLSWKQRTIVHDSTRQSAVLAPDESRPVRERGWIVLAGAVCLVRSARRFVPTARGSLGPSADDRVTRNA